MVDASEKAFNSPMFGEAGPDCEDSSAPRGSTSLMGCPDDGGSSSSGGSIPCLGCDDDGAASHSSDGGGDSASEDASDSSDEKNRPYILPEDLLAGEMSDGGMSEDDDGAPPLTEAGSSGPATGADPTSTDFDDRSLPALTLCASTFSCVEDLYGYLLLRGARQLTEDQYLLVQKGFNISSPVPLPSLTRVRARLAPRLLPWMLPTTTYELTMKDPGKSSKVQVQCILPSLHVKRDIAFDATFQKLFDAEKRSDEERSLHTDFIDCPLYTHRSDVLETGRTIQRITLDGVRVSVGDRLTVVSSPPLPSHRVIVTSAFFASHKSGVAQCNDVHAGHLAVTCVGDGDHQMSGSLVARHWMASAQAPLSWSPKTPSDTYHDVQELQAHDAGDAAVPGNATATPGGSSSTQWQPRNGMRDGVPYATVSLAINSDDFEARRGKNELLGGVYMMWQY